MGFRPKFRHMLVALLTTVEVTGQHLQRIFNYWNKYSTVYIVRSENSFSFQVFIKKLKATAPPY